MLLEQPKVLAAVVVFFLFLHLVAAYTSKRR
jgi:hypothetical protein